MPRPYVKTVGRVSEAEEKEIRAVSDRARRKDAFWAEHYGEYLKLYPNKYVAADDHGVVAVDDDLVGIVQKIEEIGRKPTDLYVRYLDTDYGNWIL